MTFRGKRYRQAAEQTGQGSFYAVDEALALVKKTASAKFDETVDVSINLGVNAKNRIRMSGVQPYCRKERVKRFA